MTPLNSTTEAVNGSKICFFINSDKVHHLLHSRDQKKRSRKRKEGGKEEETNEQLKLNTNQLVRLGRDEGPNTQGKHEGFVSPHGGKNYRE